MYVEPSWIDLLVSGAFVKIIFIIIPILFSFLLTNLTFKILKWNSKWNNEDRTLIKSVMIVAITIILLIPSTVVSDMVWNECYEQPSVREGVITVQNIQPLPGAVDVSENGYYIDNSNQLMFISTDGKEYANIENWMFNKFETRSIFNQLKVGGTYKIKYYGWRNGHSNEFPNILSVEEVIDESNATTNEYDKYFGANKGQRSYDLDMYNEYGD